MVMFDPLGGGDRAMFIQTTATQAGRLTRGRFSVPGHDGREPGGRGGSACSRGPSCVSLTTVPSQFWCRQGQGVAVSDSTGGVSPGFSAGIGSSASTSVRRVCLNVALGFGPVWQNYLPSRLEYDAANK